jgi:outer membrane protein TolC
MKPSKLIFPLFAILTSCSFNSSYKEVLETKKMDSTNWLTCKKTCTEDPFIEGILSLKDSIKLALNYNKKLKATLEEEIIAKSRYMQAASHFLPKLTADAKYNRLDKTPYLYSGNEKISIGNLNNYSVDLNVRQAIFAGGAIKANAIGAYLNKYVAKEKILKQIQNTIFHTKKAYFDLLLAKKLFEVNVQAVKTAKEHLEEVKNKLENGLASNFDVLRAKVDVTNFQAEAIRQKNFIKITKANLYKILGVSQKSKTSLKEELSYEKIEITFNEALEIAFNKRPELLIAELDVGIQKQFIKIAKSKYFPKIDFTYSNRWGRPDPHAPSIDNWGRQWSLFITLQWDIFDPLRRSGRIKEQKAFLKQKKYYLQDTMETISLEIQKAISLLENADKLIESQKFDLERAEEGLKLTKLGYKEGIYKEVQVADALSSMTKSSSFYYKSIYQHALAKLKLDLAMGTLGSLNLKKEKQ